MMNRIQKIIAAAGVSFFLIMSVLPPWKLTTTGDTMYREIPRGYYLIFAPPPPDAPAEDEENVYSLVIDFQRLVIQWIAVLFVLAAALFLTQDKRNTNTADEEDTEVIF